MSKNFLIFVFCIFYHPCVATVVGIPTPALDILKIVQESATLEQAAEQIWGQELASYSQQLIEKIRLRYSPAFQPGAMANNKEGCLNYLYAQGGWAGIKHNPQKSEILEEKICHRGKTLEETRRGVVKLLTKTITQVLLDWGFQKLNWEAIGTVGPNSDIDYSVSMDCTKTNTNSQIVCLKQKDYGEFIAKVLFDLLAIYIFKSTSGDFFDTEAYTSPNSQINIYWKPLAQSVGNQELSPSQKLEISNYTSLSFTLTQLQTVRFLEKPLMYKGNTILTWPLFKLAWRGKRFGHLQQDAEQFARQTKFKGSKHRIILSRLQDVIKIFRTLKQEKDPAKIHQLHLMLKSYYPEAYYTNGAYLQVCYSDRPRSQAFMTAAAKKLAEGYSILTNEDIEEIKHTEGLVTIVSFEYAISAAENLAYALHKLQEGEGTPQDNLFSRFLNASKYLLRIARGLEEYAQTNPDVIDVKNLQKLSRFSLQLERLKRGFPPFTSAKDIKSFLNSVFQVLEQSYLQNEI